MSTRKQIDDAIGVALAASTGIVHVSNKREAWWDWPPQYFPGVHYTCADEAHSRWAYLQATSPDMYATYMQDIWGYTFDINNDFEQKQTDLIQAIEIAIATSTALNDLTLDAVIVDVQADAGMVDNFNISKLKLAIKYEYNHLTP